MLHYSIATGLLKNMVVLYNYISALRADGGLAAVEQRSQTDPERQQ
jgi:hypothetical protein